jgi:WD40 repeat protein
LSPDGQTLTAALETPAGESVMTWVLPSGRLLGPPISAGSDTVVRIADDGRRLFTSNPMKAYDVKSGRPVWHAPRAAGLDVHEDVVAVSAADGSRVHILDASNGRRVSTLIGDQGTANDLAFSPNGAALAANVGDGRATVWDVESGRIEHSLPTGAQGGIAFSDFSDTLFTGGSPLGSLLTWDLQGRRSYLTRVAMDGFPPLPEGSVRVSPNGSWIAMSSTVPGRPELRLGSIRPDSAVRVVVPGGDWRGVGAWNPDASRYVYADNGGFLNLINPADGSRLRRQQVTSRPIVDVTYADADQILALAEGNVLVIVDAQTLEVKDRIEVPAVSTGVTATARLAVVTSAASEGGDAWRVPVTKWHLLAIEDGRSLGNGEVGVSSASVASFSPDGTRIAFGGEEEDLAILTMPVGGEVVSTESGSGERVSALAWSPDASLVIANIGSELRLWDATRGFEIAQVSLPTGEVSSAAGFAPDGSISIATLAGNVYRWDPSAQAAVDFACRVAGRDITPAEWSDAFGDRPLQAVCP